MKIPHLNKYSAASILLFGAACGFIDLALLIDRDDIASSSFVIAGMVCAMTGIFTLTFSWNEPLDPRLIGFLPAQGCLNLCSTMSLLGISGNAYFLPPRITGKTQVMQFNPTNSFKGPEVPASGSLWGPESSGLVTIPLCDLLNQDLKKRNALVIPHKEEELTMLLRETIEDVFKFVPRVSVLWHGMSVTLTFHDYPSLEGCTIIAQRSTDCCMMNPCPMCSLCGVLIAEGKDKVVSLKTCSFSASTRDVTAVFELLP